MDLWATKTHGETEDEETDRLVHRAPKYKPPRHDRRRERVETSRDPDIDEDPDISRDPDRSKNYKDIGGSLAQRVARRFLADGQTIKVRHRETGKVVDVLPETLKEEGGKYEKIEKEDGGQGGEDLESSKRGDALREVAKGDERVQGLFKSLLNPKSDLGGLAEGNPNVPAASILKGVQLPEGVKTLGDVVKALRSKPAPKAKPEPAPTPAEKPKGTEGAPAEKPESKEEAPATEKPKKPKAKKAPKEAPPKEEETKTLDGTRKHIEQEKAKAEEEAKADLKQAEADAEDQRKEIEADAEKDRAEYAGDSKALARIEKDTKKSLADVDKWLQGEKDRIDEDKAKNLKSVEEEGEELLDRFPEAEKAGIAPPKRREASKAEEMEAMTLVIDTFPEHIAADLLAKNLHPDDVKSLVSSYHAAKQMPVKNPAEFAAKTAGFYETDPDRVKPPTKAKNADGELVPFEELSPEEQSEAMRQHQVQVVALSLGAKQALTDKLSMPSPWTSAPRVDPKLASSLATFMLHKGGAKEADEMADQMFTSALAGQPSKTKEGVSKELLGHLSPEAKKIAQAYFQAADYHKAKKDFLGKDEDQISEYSSPSSIMKTMKKAGDFFKEQSKAYGGKEGDHRAASAFRLRVLDRLRALDPDKYKEVRTLIAKDEKVEYDKQKSAYDKQLAEWKAKKKAWEAKQPPYRGSPFQEEKPVPPPEPAFYHLAEDPKAAQRKAESTFEEVLQRTKTASRVASRFVFTYSGRLAMGSESGRTGVYHGIDPMENYPRAYPGWQQAHQRDLGEDDFKAILASAKDWLKTSVLSVAIEGITRDQQLRAALDLAIHASKYSRQIQQTVYNRLLARLAGKPEPGLGQTLLTIREANSSFAPAKKGTTMKPSKELRKLAAKAAETDPKLAFEMIELADAMEQQAPKTASAPAAAPAADQRYSQLKALVIRTAALDAGAKKTLMPVLQAIKTLG